MKYLALTPLLYPFILLTSYHDLSGNLIKVAFGVVNYKRCLNLPMMSKSKLHSSLGLGGRVKCSFLLFSQLKAVNKSQIQFFHEDKLPSFHNFSCVLPLNIYIIKKKFIIYSSTTAIYLYHMHITYISIS